MSNYIVIRKRDLNKYERRKERKEERDGIPWERDSLLYLRMICEYARAMGRLLRESATVKIVPGSLGT